MIEALAFYMFAAVAVGSAMMVVVSRNAVHSVLFLILAFFSSSGLFVLLGAEFIAMIMVIVYVGAVAVLFLFVVMMLDVNFAELRQGFQQYLPIGGLVGFILMVELAMIGAAWHLSPDTSANVAAAIPAVDSVTNTDALGRLLYTRYAYLFQASGLILLVAMIGAIVLTHRKRKGVRKQNIAAQVARTPEQSVELKKVVTGRGI